MSGTLSTSPDRPASERSVNPRPADAALAKRPTSAPSRPRRAAPAIPRTGTRSGGLPRLSEFVGRYLPPVRLVWCLLLLLAVETGLVASRGEAIPLFAMTVVAIATDLAFQWVRFPRIRAPDAAIATSLFLALILWPPQFDLPLASIVVASIGLRHIVRVAGHPVLNPAATGATIATAVFGLTASWHLGTSAWDAAVVAVLGAILVLRSPSSYRLPFGFFLAYLPAVVVLTVGLNGSGASAEVLAAAAFSPPAIFLGALMVPEPQTAPTAPALKWVYGGLVGLTAAVLPILLGDIPSLAPIGVLSPFVALFVGNAFTLGFPGTRGARHSAPGRARPSRPTPRPSRTTHAEGP